MKKVFAFIVSFFLYANLVAQQQWKFHIAFEEASGQKDTIWLLWDSTSHAVFPIDTSLGEGAIALDHSIFNVWLYNQNGDTTKTMAYPFNVISFLLHVEAINYQYPLNIYWDSSLFSRTITVGNPIIDIARIDNDYFWSQNNDNLLQAYNMFLDNHAYAPAFNWFSQSQFPMGFLISRTPFSSVESINTFGFKFIPNPTKSISKINCKEKILSIRINDLMGNPHPIDIKIKDTSAEINVSNLPNATYLLTILTQQNHIYHEKIIKSD